MMKCNKDLMQMTAVGVMVLQAKPLTFLVGI